MEPVAITQTFVFFPSFLLPSDLVRGIHIFFCFCFLFCFYAESVVSFASVFLKEGIFFLFLLQLSYVL